MKTIYIIRHAKSSWKFPELDDKMRPLNKRGYQSASLMGQALLKRKSNIDLMLSSPATRALSTAQIISTILNYKIKDIQIEDNLYTFSNSGEIIFNHLKTLPNHFNSVAVYGHNSTFENIAHKISKGEIIHFPTCAILALKFNSKSWSNINMDEIKIDYFMTPKQLGSLD